MAETTIAFRCNDFVLVAATGLNSFYYIKINDTEDKVTQLDSHKLVACVGENGPRVHYVDYIKCNLALNKMRNHGRIPSTATVGSYMRSALAGALRSRGGAYPVNSLLAGYDAPLSDEDDTTGGAHLFYLDYLGTLQEVPYGCHGYGTSFVTAMLDRAWRPDLSAQEGLDLMQKCCDEVKRRIVISNEKFICKVVTVRGVELVESVQ